MSVKGRAVALAWLAGLVPATVTAQTAAPQKPAAAPNPPAPAEDADDANEIVVTGSRAQPGAVIGDIPPEKQLGAAEIRSYGVSSIAELLDELAPETASGRGRGGGMPVVLLNGRRISGFGEIRNIPTEAIQRVDILPEEVALKYGYRADQKVVNFVLRPRFRAVTGEATDRIATGGGTNTPGGEGDLIRIRRDERFNADVNYNRTSALTEAERNIPATTGAIPAAGIVASPDGGEIDPSLSALAGTTVTATGLPAGSGRTLADFLAAPVQVDDDGRYRTLVARSDDLSANLVYARPLGAFSASVNGRVEATDSHSLQGLADGSLLVPAGTASSPFADPVTVERAFPSFGPLRQDTSGLTSHLGFTVNRDLTDWHLSLTGNYDRAETRTRTDRGVDLTALQAAADAGTVDPFGPVPDGLVSERARDRARSVSDTGGLDFLVTGSPLKLPAGRVNTSLRVGAETSDFTSRATRLGVDSRGDVSRQTENGQLNVDLPITSRREHVLDAVGDLSLNANLALDHLSDFGTLKTLGYGLHWSPITQVDVIASATDERGAPTAAQLGSPTVLTPGVRIFDFVRGTTVDIAQLSGGNPNLTADHRHVEKLGLTVRPLAKTDLSITANYVHTRIIDPIASFPLATAAIEAAFPDRFQRDEDGDLTQVDVRPVNFARETTSQLRWGFNLSIALKSKIQKQLEAWRAAHPGERPPFAQWFGARGGQGGRGRDGAAGGATPPSGANPAVAAAAGDVPPPPPEGAPPPPSPGADAPPPPPSGGGFGGGGPGGGGGRGGGGWGGGRGGGGRDQFGGRLQFAVYHTWFFRDDILIRPGVPVLDLLDGSATGNSGGQPRHQVDVQAGISQNGLGARLSATWQSGTTVNGEDVSSDLRFHPLTTANLRLFANLGQMPNLVKQHPWVRGMRVTVGVNNILDRRLRVTDTGGVTPLSYAPDLLDPVGRTVRVSVRKLFY